MYKTTNLLWHKLQVHKGLHPFLPGVYHRITLTLELPTQICNSPYYQPYNSYKVSSENLVLDQLIIPKLIFVFILITYLVDIVLIS